MDTRGTHPFRFMHRGRDGCGGPIVFMRQIPKAGSATSSADAVHLDGTPIGHGEMMVCGSCGKPVAYGRFPPTSYVERREE
jgi:hypothetical protein